MKKQILLITALTIFLSLDFFCQSWEFIGGPEGGNILCLAVDSTGNLFAGLRQGGVYTSTDNGDSWIEKNYTIGNVTINKIVVSSNNKVYIGTTGLGLYVTSNQGSEWKKVTSLNSDFINDIAITTNGNLLVIADKGLFISSDDGTSWNLSDSTLNYYVEVMGNGNIIAANYDSIYISSNNGNTWDNINNDLPQGTILDLLIAKSNDYIYTSVISQGVYRSSDMGISWTGVNNGLDYPIINCLYSSIEGYLYAGTSQDIYLSTNFGEIWFSIKTPGLKFPWIYSIVENSSGDIFAGTFGAGVYLYPAGGNDWELKNQGLNRAAIRKILVEDDFLFCIAYGSGIFRSSDNGITWENINGSIPSLHAYSIYRHTDGSLFIGTFGGTYKSTNNGQSWIYSGSVNANAFASNSLGYIFAGHGGNGLYRSTDAGLTWENINNGITWLSIQQLEVNSNDDIFALYPEPVYRSTDYGNTWILVNDGLTGHLYSIAIDSSNNLFVGSNTGFFMSSNYGNNWTQMSLQKTFREINIDPLSRIYGVKIGGIYFSDDNGINWNKVGELSDTVYYNTIGIKSAEYILLGTEGSGLYKFDLLTSNDNLSYETIESFRLSQNYPNPFNPSTTIRYEIPQRSFVTVKIYDLLGNEVATLVNEEKPSGNYVVEFNAIGRPSGIYFYQLRADAFVETKKMALTK